MEDWQVRCLLYTVAAICLLLEAFVRGHQLGYRRGLRDAQTKGRPA